VNDPTKSVAPSGQSEGIKQALAELNDIFKGKTRKQNTDKKDILVFVSSGPNPTVTYHELD
jgi:hypothetical protein